MKTIDMVTKEWFDRVYGNSYFSARITIDYGMENEKEFVIPFKYGYGSYSKQKAMELIRKNYPELENIRDWELKDKGVILRYTKYENCLKREVKAWGE